MTQPSTVICQHGINCTDDRAGHAMTFMRQRMAHLHHDKFLTVKVVGFDGEWARLEDLMTGESFLAWNHEDLRSIVEIGDLAAASPLYNVLAANDARYNVAIVRESAEEWTFDPELLA